MITHKIDNENIISEYLTETLHSVKLLYENKLYAQALLIIMASIDSFGLLDAPIGIKKSSSLNFKSWVDKYLCINASIEYKSSDLWAYRCSILHTFTVHSDLSESRKARSIIFYLGNKKNNQYYNLKKTLSENNSNYLFANIATTIVAFSDGCRLFARELDEKSTNSPVIKERLSRLLHTLTI